MLYLVPTPIGNLEDITLRALNTLKAADVIYCEDTRHSKRLLDHYEIQTPLKAYHKFNEASKEHEILQAVQEGKTVCLISDAGSPALADPGERLVQLFCKEKAPLTALPGPCALVCALTASGFPTQPFQFLGFLPKKEGERAQALLGALHYQGTSLFYESPQRLLKSLKHLNTLCSRTEVVVAREISKKFETFHRGTPQELLAHWEDKDVKGELVLLIKGLPETESAKHTMTAKEHVAFLSKEFGLKDKEAIKLAAELRGVPKRHVYQECLDS